MEYREWKLTDQEIASLNERGGNVGEAQEAKKQAFKKAGGIILNPDALPDLYEACKEALLYLHQATKLDIANARQTLTKAIAKVEGG